MKDAPVSYPQKETLSPIHTAINEWLHKLAEVERHYSATWGVARLPSIVSPETQAKWNRHTAKLASAIAADDLWAVEELAQGSVRGWAAMENEATSLGRDKLQPRVVEVVSDLTGTIYRIWSGAQPTPRDGVVDEPVECVARILDAAQLVNQPKWNNTAEQKRGKISDDDMRDDLPF
jgi:hypothetical protein